MKATIRCPRVKGIPAAEWHRGIAVEMEHTRSRVAARCISAAHFEESGALYYVELLKMEKRLRRRHGR